MDQIKAEFKDGVLNLFAPREEGHGAKKIQLE
jgi:HSP20 family molecular chaperone IbpA